MIWQRSWGELQRRAVDAGRPLQDQVLSDSSSIPEASSMDVILDLK